MTTKSVEVKLDAGELRVLQEGLRCYWESMAAGNYEEKEGPDDSEAIAPLQDKLAALEDGLCG